MAKEETLDIKIKVDTAGAEKAVSKLRQDFEKESRRVEKATAGFTKSVENIGGVSGTASSAVSELGGTFSEISVLAEKTGLDSVADQAANAANTLNNVASVAGTVSVVLPQVAVAARVAATAIQFLVLSVPLLGAAIVAASAAVVAIGIQLKNLVEDFVATNRAIKETEEALELLEDVFPDVSPFIESLEGIEGNLLNIKELIKESGISTEAARKVVDEYVASLVILTQKIAEQKQLVSELETTLADTISEEAKEARRAAIEADLDVSRERLGNLERTLEETRRLEEDSLTEIARIRVRANRQEVADEITLRELRRDKLDDEEREADIIKEINELNQEANQAIRESDFEKAEAAIERQKSLALSLELEEEFIKASKQNQDLLDTKIRLEQKKSQELRKQKNTQEIQIDQQKELIKDIEESLNAFKDPEEVELIQQDLEAAREELKKLEDEFTGLSEADAPFDAALKAANKSVEELQEELLTLTDTKEIKIKADEIREAKEAAEELREELERLALLEVTPNVDLTQSRRYGGLIYGFNRGGKVPGFGGGDTVPAMLEPGEFVLRKEAVASTGLNFLNNLNTGILKMQNGGLVSNVTSSSQVFEVNINIGGSSNRVTVPTKSAAESLVADLKRLEQGVVNG